jgi:hypothetical protein
MKKQLQPKPEFSSGEEEVQTLISAVFHLLKQHQETNGGSALFYKSILDSVSAGWMLSEATKEANFRAAREREDEPPMRREPSASDTMYA